MTSNADRLKAIRIGRLVFGVLGHYREKAALQILTLSVLSAIFLAWSATLSLRGVLQPTPHDRSTFSINLTGSPQNSPGDSHDEFSVVRLVVDGRRARPADLLLKGDWQPGWDSADRPKGPEGDDTTSWPRRAGWAARLNLAVGDKPASVSFSGRTAALLVEHADRCEHLSISTEAGKIWDDDCSHFAGSNHSIEAVDLPVPAATSYWSFALWLVLSLIVVAVIKPRVNDKRTELWLLTYLTVLHFIVWSTQCVGLIYDSLNQLPSLMFNLQGWPAYFPPGYPLLVGIGYLVSGTYTGLVITCIQHVMMVAVILWCFRLLRRCVSEPNAYLTVLALGAAAPTLFLPQTIMSENAALFGLAGSLYFAVRYMDSDLNRYSIASGVLLGWAAMARVVPLAAGVPATVLVILGAKPTMAGLRQFATILAVAVAILIIPVIWFGSRSGSFALANSTGRHMYNRIVTDQFLLDTSGPATKQFLQLIAPVNPERKTHWEIAAVLKQKGLDYGEIERMMRRVSWEGMRRSPFQFIAFSLRQSWTQYFHNPIPLVPWWSVPDKYTVELESVPIFGVHAGALLWRAKLEQQFAVIWTFSPWLALAGLASVPLLRQRLVFLSFAVIPFGYIVASAFVEFEYGRYTVAIVPFIYCLAAGAFGAFASRYWQNSSTMKKSP